jgi:hypothetical protein
VLDTEGDPPHFWKTLIINDLRKGGGGFSPSTTHQNLYQIPPRARAPARARDPPISKKSQKLFPNLVNQNSKKIQTKKHKSFII